MAGPCDICEKRSMPKSIYCASCGHFVLGQHEGHARALAMKAARREDGFHCAYTDVLLDMRDPNNPWYGTFDHPVPGLKGGLVFTGFVVNANKTDLTPEEYRKVVRENVHHWDTGEPFDRNVVSFESWRMMAARRLAGRKVGGSWLSRSPPAGSPLERLLKRNFGPMSAAAKECKLCGERIFSPAKYCKICSLLVLNSHQGSAAERVETLIKGRRPDGTYRCHYLDVELDILKPESPFDLWFDHRIPRTPGTMVLASRLANTRKTDMSEEEFRAFERQLDNRFSGGKFDKKAVKFRYWRRHGRAAGGIPWADGRKVAVPLKARKVA